MRKAIKEAKNQPTIASENHVWRTADIAGLLLLPRLRTQRSAFG